VQGLTGNIKTEWKPAAHPQTFHSLKITSVSIATCVQEFSGINLSLQCASFQIVNL